jgi:hypothetical protein
VQEPPQQPQPPQQPWGRQPWGQPAPQPPPQQPRQEPWGQPAPKPPPQQPWGYRPPTPKPQRPPGTPPPWYKHPVGLLLIAAVVVILLALVVPAFTGGGQQPVPTVTTGAFGAPGTTVAPAATTTSAGQPLTFADRLRQAAQTELREAGEVTGVTAPPGGQITVTWEIRQAGSQGLTENNARFGVMRIMRAIQQTGAGTGDDYQGVRLIGRYQLAGQAAPTTVVRLRFTTSTIERAEFDDRNYLEAFELADAAAIHPAFRG